LRFLFVVNVVAFKEQISIEFATIT